MKSAYDIIIRPVLTEKSYAEMSGPEVHLRSRRERGQDRDQAGG